MIELKFVLGKYLEKVGFHFHAMSGYQDCCHQIQVSLRRHSECLFCYVIAALAVSLLLMCCIFISVALVFF